MWVLELALALFVAGLLVTFFAWVWIRIIAPGRSDAPRVRAVYPFRTTKKK